MAPIDAQHVVDLVDTVDVVDAVGIVDGEGKGPAPMTLSRTAVGALVCAGLLLLTGGCGRMAPKSLIEERIDWGGFLARHDLVWKRLPASWREAAFLGNGQLAMSMWQEPGKNALRFTVDRGDVYDRRDESWGWCAYSRPRYHVGDFQLHPVGEITGLDMRQDLYNAELRGTLTTRKGEIEFRAFVHATEDVMVVELTTTEGEKACRWVWRPYEARTTRDNGGVKSEEEAKKGEFRKMLKKVFDGALSPMLQFLVDNEDFSKEDVKRLRQIANKVSRSKRK